MTEQPYVPDVCKTCKSEQSCRPAEYVFLSERNDDCPLYQPVAQAEVMQ